MVFEDFSRLGSPLITTIDHQLGYQLCIKKDVQSAPKSTPAPSPGWLLASALIGNPADPEREVVFRSPSLPLTARKSTQRSVLFLRDVTFFQSVNDKLGNWTVLVRDAQIRGRQMAHI